METIKQAQDIDSLLDKFQLLVLDSHPILDNWLDAKGNLNTDDDRLLKILHHRITKYGDYWNEEELKINFIGLLFLLVDIDEEGKIKTFFERSLSAVTESGVFSITAERERSKNVFIFPSSSMSTSRKSSPIKLIFNSSSFQ